MVATLSESPRVIAVMSDGDVGASIQRRRVALGLTVKALAEKAGVDRGRLAAIEDGASARSSTIGAIERALTAFEEEISGPFDDDEESGMVTFRLAGNFGVDVVVQGPVSNLHELEESVARLIAKMGNESDRD